MSFLTGAECHEMVSELFLYLDGLLAICRGTCQNPKCLGCGDAAQDRGRFEDAVRAAMMDLHCIQHLYGILHKGYEQSADDSARTRACMRHCA